jgi:hypothetical protein
MEGDVEVQRGASQNVREPILQENRRRIDELALQRQVRRIPSEPQSGIHRREKHAKDGRTILEEVLQKLYACLCLDSSDNSRPQRK